MEPSTPVLPEFPPEDRRVGRRAVLGMLGLGAAGVLWGAKAQSGLERVLRPLTLNDSTGLSAFLPTSGRFRIYSVTGTMPSRTDAEYRLTVDGHVERPARLAIADVRERLPQTEMTKDFQCVTGWRVDDVEWKGVVLKDLLDDAGMMPGASHVRFWSFDGVYTETLTLEQALRPDVLIAHEMLGGPVTQEHGGPVRLYVAPMYGYKSLKWLDRIEVVTGGLQLDSDPGYWERLGYDVDAWVGDSNYRDDAPT
ncbi:MAG: molybdopterin-dependent oxidoreductase [Acidimicrobiales bacterium]|nr:molybdopterin-dependent oxidoreductase [Acidimicrobiales bacterium]